MRLPAGHHRTHEFGAMTSMIDVVLFLLMFFVVNAGSGNMAKLLPVPLARPGNIESPDTTPNDPAVNTVDIWLRLKRDQASKQTIVDMNGTEYSSLDELKQILVTLADLDAENPIIFATAPDVPLGDLVTLYDTCQAAGFKTISFAAQSSGP